MISLSSLFNAHFTGTCVNVGCIPKKLMHTAATLGDRMADSIDFGWTHVGQPDEYGMTDTAKQKFLSSRSSNFSWQTMVGNVQDHIRSLNFKYRVDLRGKGIDYINALGRFVDPHTVETTDKKGNKTTVTADKVVIAVGGRPAYPDIPGALEYAISSDDIFSFKKTPGKTLVIGASYVALECAGFINGFGFDTTVMIRSIPLRGFDRTCADKILQNMIHHGTKVLQPCSPTRIDKLAEDDGKLRVTFQNNETKEEGSDVFDTVLVAVGRHPETRHLGLENAGVQVNPKTGKIIVNDVEQTSTSNIYAIGDVIDHGLELTPVAIQAGKLLSERLFAGSTKKMDYINVPTTVFTPLEYGCVGLSEEDAVAKYGQDDLIIYYKNFNVLEYTVPHRDSEQAYMKLICVKSENERVAGFHYCGPNAGEMTQAVAIAMKLGATKENFDDTVGIHPTCAETMTTLVFGETEDTGC